MSIYQHASTAQQRLDGFCNQAVHVFPILSVSRATFCCQALIRQRILSVWPCTHPPTCACHVEAMCPAAVAVQRQCTPIRQCCQHRWWVVLPAAAAVVGVDLLEEGLQIRHKGTAQIPARHKPFAMHEREDKLNTHLAKLATPFCHQALVRSSCIHINPVPTEGQCCGSSGG